MNNETQLAKWREEFLVKQPANYTRDNPRFIHDAELKGFLRAKQEDEQALPLITGEPKAWLIKFKDTDGNQRSRVYTHNAIGDYRQIDPNATSEELFTHAQPQQDPIAFEALDELLGQYWDAAHKEGKTGIPQSTEANDILHKMRQLVKPPQPITDKDVTAEMINLVAEFDANFNSNGINVDQIAAIAMAFIVNTFNSISIKHKGDTK